jgi:single-strand DNA-binding protein
VDNGMAGVHIGGYTGPNLGNLLTQSAIDMIKMTVIGNLGRDAEVKDVNGKKVIEFSVAHSEKYTDRSGQQQERTTWVRCNYWRDGDRVGVADYLKKGKQVYVEGTPSVAAYTTKENQPGASLDLRVLSLELIGGREGGGAPSGGQGGGYSAPQSGGYNRPGPSGPAPEPGPMDPADDLPF